MNEQQIYLKSITEKLRDFLLAFFGKYKMLQAEATLDRDVLVVYFHISNSLFKRVNSRFYIPYQEMIALTKEVFQGNYGNDFTSIDRMDLINLAGIHKYNALSIFQRVLNNIYRFIAEFSSNRQKLDHASWRSSKNRLCQVHSRRLAPRKWSQSQNLKGDMCSHQYILHCQFT